MTRTLIQIPVVYVPFGVLDQKTIDYHFVNPNSKDITEAVKKDVTEIIKKIVDGNNAYWDEIDNYLDSNKFDKVYQEETLVEQSLADILQSFREYQGRDRNVDAFLKLADKGVPVIGTESSYSIAEYRKRKNYKDANAMEPRDQFVAANIANTLKDGETGILFLGADRWAVGNLIKTKYPNFKFGKFQKDPWFLVELLKRIRIR